MLPRLDIDRDADRFVEEFFLPERPAIFPNAVRACGSASELCCKLQSRIAADAQKTERSMWYDVREELLDEICQTPPLIDRLMNEEDAFLRDNCVRIWVSDQGNVSPWHYDGHSLHVFNLQLFGRKRWTIVAPDTPLLCMPFNNVCMLNHYSLSHKQHFEFTLDEGDIVFLPRYWYHLVVAEKETNVNVNWVLMPKTSPPDTPGARREAELMWLKDRFYPVMPPHSRWLVNHYAGAGREAVRCLTRDTKAHSALLRLAKEVLSLPVLVGSLPAQLHKALRVRRSKRVLEQFVAASPEKPLGG